MDKLSALIMDIISSGKVTEEELRNACNAIPSASEAKTIVISHGGEIRDKKEIPEPKTPEREPTKKKRRHRSRTPERRGRSRSITPDKRRKRSHSPRRPTEQLPWYEKEKAEMVVLDRPVWYQTVPYIHSPFKKGHSFGLPYLNEVIVRTNGQFLASRDGYKFADPHPDTAFWIEGSDLRYCSHPTDDVQRRMCCACHTNILANRGPAKHAKLCRRDGSFFNVWWCSLTCYEYRNLSVHVKTINSKDLALSPAVRQGPYSIYLTNNI